MKYTVSVLGLVALLTVAPCHGFSSYAGPALSHGITSTSRMYMVPGSKDEELEELQRETNEALQAAKKAIQDADANVVKRQMIVTQGEKPSPPNVILDEEVAKRQVKAAKEPSNEIADAAVGILKSVGDAIGGFAMSLANKAVEEVKKVPSKIASAAEQKAQETAEEIKKIPGRIAGAAERKAQETAEEIKSIPGKLANAAERKAKETVEDIAKIPGKIAVAAEKKVAETAEEIASIPGKVADAAERTAKETADEIARIPGKIVDAAEKKTAEIVEEIEAIPGKFSSSTKAAVAKTVDEMKALPQELKEDISKVIPVLEKKPVPPKMPPNLEQEPVMPTPPKIELPTPPKWDVTPPPPKVTLTAAEPTPKTPEEPRIRLPKLEVPKVSLPKVEVPKIPQPPKEPPKKEKASEDAFVFTEVSLKKFVSGSKEPATAKAPIEDRAVNKKAEIARRQEEALKKEQVEARKKEQKAKEAAKKRDQERRAEEAKERARAAIEAKKRADEERRQAAERAAEVRVAKARADAEAKKRAAEEKRAEAQRREEEQEMKKATILKSMQAQVSVEKAKPRPTFSLAGLFGGKEVADEIDESSEEAPSRPTVQPKKMASPPRATPVISDWKQNRDGSITGRISGKSGFTEGEKVTTSPIGGKAVDGSLVQTSSGSKYYLEDKQAAARAAQEEKRRKAEEGRAKAAAAAVAKRAVLREKTVNTAAAAEAKRAALQEKQAKAAAAAAGAKRAALEEQREKAAAAAEAKRVALEDKRRKADEAKAKGAKAAEMKRVAAEQKRQADVEKRQKIATQAEAKRKEGEQKKAQAARAKQAQASVEKAKPRATFSLASLFGGEEEETDVSSGEAPVRPAVQPKKMASPPRGTPIISDWKQNRDGSITGRISGGTGFKNGERISTSPIGGEAIGGALVQTSSGSKYYLEDKAAAVEEKRRKLEESKVKAQAARQAQVTEKAAKPRATISLFGLGQEMDSEPSAPQRAATSAKAPRGVPTIIKWKRRNDGGVTGLIYGSPNFDDGERVETSPIVGGTVADGTVVRTGSGSRYFLSADESIRAANRNKAMKDMKAARPGATITLTRERKEMEARAASQESKSRPTFSIFGGAGGGGGDQKQPQASRPSKQVPPKLEKAPRGIPSIVKWRKNFDGSVTGFISGSPNFAEGEKVTTSPITDGTIAARQVVKTGSGSRYFLV